jgi:hypothetical protein
MLSSSDRLVGGHRLAVRRLVWITAREPPEADRELAGRIADRRVRIAG